MKAGTLKGERSAGLSSVSLMTRPMPIIVGVPRSGTTLLRMMIDAHPLVSIPPETGFLPALAELEPGNDGASRSVLAIAPYDAARRRVRAMIEDAGGFVLVHVSTPLEVCEQRDPKGLYARARAGGLPHFTGISDPYEAPTDADIVIDATSTSPNAAAEQILSVLSARGYCEC